VNEGFIHKKTHIQLKLKQVVSLAVFLLRPQADFKSAHLSKIVNIYANVNYLKVFLPLININNYHGSEA
jgi:hypothetical protein